MTDWIPASEPPKILDDILFADIDGAVCLGHYYHDGLFYDDDGERRYNIVYWMPIPPLPDNSPGWRHMW